MNHAPQNHSDKEAAAMNEKRHFETMAEALQAGKNDGAAKAREKGPELKSGITDVAHDLAYGLAFGSVFAGAFLNELIPQSVREGFCKGASAGRKAGRSTGGKVNHGLSTGYERVGPEEPANPSFS